VRLTASLIEEFRTDISALTLIPLGNGIFDVKVDGKLVYSKYQTGRFPDDGEVEAMVTAALG
jgi:selenoprotein W-related protein